MITLSYTLLGMICDACESPLGGQRFASMVDLNVVAPYSITTIVTKALCSCLMNEHKVIWSIGRMNVLGLQLQQCPMPVPYVTLAGMPIFSYFDQRSQTYLDIRTCSTMHHLHTCRLGTFTHMQKLCITLAKGTASADGKTAAQHL